MSSFERDGSYLSPLSVVVVPDSGTAQLMVAMQPGVDLSTVEVQEVVVVTDRDRRFRSSSIARGNHGSCYYGDDEEGNADMHSRGEDEIVEYDYGSSETVAAEIEVVDGRSSLEGFLGTKARRGRLKRRNGRFAKKSPPTKAIRTKTMSRKRFVESSPQFGESDSDAVDEAGYGGSLLKRRKRDFAHRLQWRDADMQAAMLAVREKNATIRGAAKQFDVPYSTLKDRVRNRVKHGTKPGVKTALCPEDEEDLVRCIQQMESAGFHMHGIDIREHAHDLLNRNKHCSANSKHRSAVPGHNWLAGFLKRHPSIELSRSVNRPAVPSVSKQKHMLRRFFDVASAAYQKLSRTPQAVQLCTMTEFKLSSFPHTSLILAASANGTLLPPYVLFNGSRTLMPRLQQHFPSAFFSVYSHANQRKDVLLSWFRDHFLPHAQQTGSGRPIVLFVTQPACSISVHFVRLADDQRVSLVCMPMGILHLVQPLDEVALHKIDDLVTKCGRRYLEDRKTPSIDQIGMAEILQKVWQRGLPSREIALNFKENGLFPFNMRAVTNERIAASTPLLDVRKDEELSSDNETNGLALLSELSSLDQNIGETKNFNFGQNRTCDGVAAISPYKRHKLSPENSSFDANNFDEKISVEPMYSSTPQLSGELMKRVLTNEKKEGACSPARPVQCVNHRRQHRNAHRETQTSRQKTERLQRPIKGMFDEPSNSISTCCISSSLRNSTGSNVSKTCKNISSNSISRATDGSTSNFVTLTPVHRVIEIGPNIKQEYISYVEDPLGVQEEFVPQEIVEGQTIVEDCMTYEMPLNAFCKEEVIEELTEEVVGLPQFILPADEDVNLEGIKVENVDEFFNNNELSYDLQTEEVSNVTGNGCTGRPLVKAFNIIPDSGSKLSLDNGDATTTYIEVNGCSYPVVQTLSIQEFRKTFGIVSQAAGLLLENGSEDIKDEN